MPLEGRITRLWFKGAEQVASIETAGHVFRARLHGTDAAVGDRLLLRLPLAALRLYRDGRLVA